jgi:transposase
MNDIELYRQLLGIVPPWQVVHVAVDPQKERVDVTVAPTPDATFRCPVCQRPGAGYDLREERTWRHLDSCAFTTWLRARLPRVECPEHGVRTVAFPWGEPHSRFTEAFACLARRVLRETRVQARTAALLRLSPDEVRDLLARTVVQGLQARGAAREQEAVDPVRHWSLDETHAGPGQQYVAVLGDPEGQRVWEVAAERTAACVADLLETSLTAIERAAVESVTVDLWQGFLDACRRVLPQATLVYDPFHAAQELNQAIEKTRATEHRQLRQERQPGSKRQYGDSPLTGTRYWWLRRAEDLKPERREQLWRWQAEGLETAQVWAFKEAFRPFFTQESVAAGRQFLQEWCVGAITLGNEPLRKVALQFQKHQEKLLAYLEQHRTNAWAEYVNGQIQQIRTRARGFKSFVGFRRAILFFLGGFDLCPHTSP